MCFVCDFISSANICIVLHSNVVLWYNYSFAVQTFAWCCIACGLFIEIKNCLISNIESWLNFTGEYWATYLWNHMALLLSIISLQHWKLSSTCVMCWFQLRTVLNATSTWAGKLTAVLVLWSHSSSCANVQQFDEAEDSAGCYQMEFPISEQG